MGNRGGQRSKRRGASITILIVILICSIFVGVRYGEYLAAVLWHWSKGPYAQLAHRKVKLPIYWYQGTSDKYDSSKVVRGGSVPNLEINSDPVMPGELRDSDEDELKATQALVASEKSSSLVVLKTAAFPLYCRRETSGISEAVLVVNLTCHSPHLRYMLSYIGPPKEEIEAESIISTLE